MTRERERAAQGAACESGEKRIDILITYLRNEEINFIIFPSNFVL